VHKYVLTVLAADKTVPLGIVKLLHCSSFHGVANSFFFDVALNLWKASSAGRSRAVGGDYWVLRKKL
jgi:hypothetical protein